MKKYLVIVPLLFVAFGVPAALRADQTYNVNFNVGSDTITGTIDTNGGIGEFVELNSFSFGVANTSSSPTGGGGTAKESDSGSIGDIVITGNAFTATAAGLFFNFDSTDKSSLEFLDADNNFILCLFTNEGCDPEGSGENLTLDGTESTITGLDGNLMIASIAPEPGTLGLMLIGIVGLVLMTRRSSARELR